jgi:hypothetical protein
LPQRPKWDAQRLTFRFYAKEKAAQFLSLRTVNWLSGTAFLLQNPWQPWKFRLAENPLLPGNRHERKTSDCPDLEIHENSRLLGTNLPKSGDG